MPKKIKFMDCSFRDGFQSCLGARVKTDDFLPALEAAVKAGINHLEIGGGARFQSLWPQLGIANDRFVRTTDEQHIKAVQRFLQKVGIEYHR